MPAGTSAALTPVPQVTMSTGAGHPRPSQTEKTRYSGSCSADCGVLLCHPRTFQGCLSTLLPDPNVLLHVASGWAVSWPGPPPDHGRHTSPLGHCLVPEAAAGWVASAAQSRSPPGPIWASTGSSSRCLQQAAVGPWRGWAGAGGGWHALLVLGCPGLFCFCTRCSRPSTPLR